MPHQIQRKEGLGLGSSEAPAAVERSPRAQLLRELAGLSYEEQLERVRPPAERSTHAGPAVQRAVDPEEPGDDRDTKVRKYKAYLDEKGIARSAQIAALVYDALDAGDNSKFDAAAALVPLDPLPSGRPLCLWSGHGCKEKAESTGVELNTTRVGKLASDWKFLGRSYPELFPLWCAVSARFVQSARGAVHIFLGYSGYERAGGIRPSSVFGSTEKQALEDLAAARPELRIVPKYHSLAAVHDIPEGTIERTAENLPVTENAGDVPQPKSLYWVTGEPGHTGHPIGAYIRPYTRSDGTPVKGHLRGL